MMSACVRWAMEEVEAFNGILARQLSSTERGGPVWTRCLERAREHAQKLADVGLDFKDMVGRGLGGPEDEAAGRVGAGGVGAGGSEAAPVGLGLA